MANQIIEVEYHQGLKPLEKVLSQVRRSGDFFVQGKVEVPLPKLEVDGVGVISFPVPQAQVRALVEHGERAPYGRGEETILDTSVRKVWQLPPAKVRYDAGAFFAAHRDTEKAEDMFGTLVVSLPSAHRGGELVIRHAGREVIVDLSSAEVSELAFGAFYADCEHEVRPIG